MLYNEVKSENRENIPGDIDGGTDISWYQVLREAQEEYGVDQSDAMLLMEYVSGWNRSEIHLHYHELIPHDVAEHFAELLEFRMQHIPVQYITGQQNFMGLELSVTPEVLIPRPETELLAERVIHACEGKDVLDLCTGSGCIAIAVRCLGRAKSVSASDISEAALAVAVKNAKMYDAQIQFRQGDLFEPWFGSKTMQSGVENGDVARKFDIIVSNPPYIPTAEIAELMPEVREYEPHLALDGMKDGLVFYRRIAAECREYLNPSGRVFLEIGCEQGKDVAEMFRKAGFANVQVYQDYAGLDRMVEAY